MLVDCVWCGFCCPFCGCCCCPLSPAFGAVVACTTGTVVALGRNNWMMWSSCRRLCCGVQQLSVEPVDVVIEQSWSAVQKQRLQSPGCQVHWKVHHEAVNQPIFWQRNPTPPSLLFIFFSRRRHSVDSLSTTINQSISQSVNPMLLCTLD